MTRKNFENEDGSRRWYDDKGRYHRDDGPAIEQPDGRKCWYRHDVQHREGGPACECSAHGRCWFRDGKRTRNKGATPAGGTR